MKVQTRELPNEWFIQVKLLQRPVVEISSGFELQSTTRVSNTFNRIAEWMGIIVQRIDAPFVSSFRMRGI